MAKIISFDNMPLANSGLKLSKNISITEIEKHPFFEALYNIDENLRKRITEDMRKNGFDPSQPVHIWCSVTPDGITHKYLIDGYTRIASAEDAGISVVPYFEHKFGTQDEAYMYTLHLQVDRRNLSEQELLDNIGLLMGTDYVQNCIGRKSEVIAETLGVSPRKVQQALSVINDATEEQKEEIASGEKTINKVYKENHPKKKEKDEEQDVNAGSWTPEPEEYAEEDSDDMSDALEETSGDPKGLAISDHSDHIERPSYRMSAKEDFERTKERHEAYESGYVEGFQQAANYILSEIANSDAESIYKEIFCSNELTKDFLDRFVPSDMGTYSTLRKDIINGDDVTDYNALPIDDAIDSDSGTQTSGVFDIADIDFSSED